MRVAVAGGTGLVGSMTVESLRESGHDPVVLARSRGVDLVSGAGLDESLTGADAVVDTSNVLTLRRRAAAGFFGAATGNLLEAGARAGVRHHVVLSIVGVDRVPTGYYAAKLLQEGQVVRGGVPWTVVRATQFHEFAAQMLDRSRGPVAVLPRMRVQPVAAREVAAHLARTAVQAPLGEVEQVAGPEVHDLVSMARRVAASSARPRRVVGVRVPGRAGRQLATGALLPTGPVTLGGETFDGWLARTGR